MSPQYPDLNCARVSRPSWLGLFLSPWLGVEDHLTLFFFWSLTALLTASVWIAWRVAFLLSANIVGSTMLRCLVDSVSFIRLLEVSLVVIEWQKFSGSRHLAKYCADSSSECSLTFSISASTYKYQHWTSCDNQWQSSEPISVYNGCFCSLCRAGLYSKQVQHSWWTQLPCKSSVLFPSVVSRMYLPSHWGYCFCWILFLLRSRYACWMIEMCLGRLLISLGIGPAVAVSPHWVLSDGSWLGVGPGWTTWLNNILFWLKKSIRSCPSWTRLFHLGSCLCYPLGPESWLRWPTRLCHQHNRPAWPVLSVLACQQCRSWTSTVTVLSRVERRCWLS